VTLRLTKGLPTLRHPRAHSALLRAIVAASGRFGSRVVHYAAMSNHIHLICEAAGVQSLGRGMRALIVRIARALNVLWHRAGPVFADRFHARPLCSPREVRNALAYALQNAEHHGIHCPGGIDPYSSARWFEGWTVPPPGALRDTTGSPLPRPRTWLLQSGWELHGRLDPLSPPKQAGAVPRRIKFPIRRDGPKSSGARSTPR
jgi:REP element-mobilizing transposase RayT